jgi:anti-sigma B factor antagonist
MNVMSFVEQPVSSQVTSIVLGKMLDNNNADSVVQAIVGARDRGCKFVIIDCESLEFLSSAGVGAILGTIEAFRDQGGDILLCNVSETISHVFRVLDLLDFLTIHKSRHDALAYCNVR